MYSICMIDTNNQCKEVEKTMPITLVQRPKCKCIRCGYEWFPDDASNMPIKCAKCNSPYWNKERIYGIKENKNVKND